MASHKLNESHDQQNLEYQKEKPNSRYSLNKQTSEYANYAGQS